MTRGRACGSDAPLSQAGTANTAVYSVVKDPGRLWPLKSLAGGSATILFFLTMLSTGVSGCPTEDFATVDARREVVGALLSGAHQDSALDVVPPIAF